MPLKDFPAIRTVLVGIVSIPVIVIGSVFFGCVIIWIGLHALEWFLPWFGLV